MKSKENTSLKYRETMIIREKKRLNPWHGYMDKKTVGLVIRDMK
jgi:hypothetical protein